MQAGWVEEPGKQLLYEQRDAIAPDLFHKFRDRYVTPAGLIFSSAPTDVASDFPTQVLGHVKSSAWRVPGQPVISHIVALWGRTACNLELQEQGVGSFLALGCMGWHQSNFILVAKTFACI